MTRRAPRWFPPLPFLILAALALAVLAGGWFLHHHWPNGYWR